MSTRKDATMRERFRELEELGRGTTASVWAGRRRIDGKEYAVKVFRGADESGACALSELAKEVLLLSSLDHPHIVRYRESFVSPEDGVCVVMDLLDGGTLGQFIELRHERRSLMPEESIWRLFVMIASAVQYLHARHILHRDLKPSNIVFESADPSSTLKLVDFGLSTCMEGDLAYTLVGTPMYAAPELFLHQPYSTGCDVWSVGCILLEMAALEPAFAARNMRELRSLVVHGTPSTHVPARYSQELCDTISLMLQPDPARRISMEAVLQLPHVAYRLAELEAEGLVGCVVGAKPSETLARALEELENTRFSLGSGCPDEVLLAMLPPPRYSTNVPSQLPNAAVYGEAPPAAPEALRAALLSALHASNGPTGSVSSRGSPQDAAMHAMALPSRFDSPPKTVPSASTGGAQVHVHVRAGGAATRAAPAPASPAVKNPTYWAMVEAEKARRLGEQEAWRASGPSSPALAPPSPEPTNFGSRGAPGAPSFAALLPRAGQRSPSGRPGWTPSTIAALRAAVAASIEAQEEAHVRHVLARCGRVLNPAGSAGPTPRSRMTGQQQQQQQQQRAQQHAPIFAGRTRTKTQMQEAPMHCGSPPTSAGKSSNAPTATQPAASHVANPQQQQSQQPAERAVAVEAACAGAGAAAAGKGSSPARKSKPWRLLALMPCGQPARVK